MVDDPAAVRPPPHVRMRASEITLAQVPVRCGPQLASKVVVGYVAHLATLRPTTSRRDLYDDITAGHELSALSLREIACNYGLTRDAWRPADTVRLFDDPVPVRFELRYRQQSNPDPRRLLMRLVESLLRQTPPRR